MDPVRADRKPGVVSLNLVRDLGMTRRSAAGQMWPGPSRVRPSWRRPPSWFEMR